MTPTIVIATDGSDAAQRAAAVVHALVPAPADWMIATVAPPREDPNADATGFAGPVISPEEAAQLDQAHLVTADGHAARTARAFGPEPIEQVVLRGEAGQALCEFAESVGASLVVLGSHGHGAVASAMLGSTVAHVLEHAPCPVLVVPAGDRASDVP